MLKPKLLQKSTNTIVCTAAIFLTLIYSTDVVSGIKNGIDISINTLIPSLFPFIVISTFIILSGTHIQLAKVFYPITKFILKMPSELGALIFISLIGGFPVGAKNIGILYSRQSISKNTAEILLSFCVNAGPAFIITGVGNRFLNNKNLGILLFISQILASLIVASIFSRISKEKIEYKVTKIEKHDNTSNSFTKSVEISLKSIALICAFVLVFCCIIEVINKADIKKGFVKSIIYIFLEVTYSCKFLASENINANIYLINAALSFCGICVIYQIKSIISEYNLSLKYFYLSRPLHIIISFFILKTLLYFNEETKQVFSSSDTIVISVQNKSIYALIFIIFTVASLMFMLIKPNRQKK